jgi:hypothetical protein
MTETVNANGLTLCHKNSPGMVRSTLPDVCKAPVYPVPFVNVAFAKTLAKGTKTVKSHKGHMCGIKGSEFSSSIGDEGGVGKGVASGTQLDKATWLSWSGNVFAEGKPVTRLTDRMLMNNGNTISAGGYFTGPVKNEANRATLDKICQFACECLAAGTMNDDCVQDKMKKWAKENGKDLHPEASYERGPNGQWIPRGTRADGSLRQSRPLGSRVPDYTDRGTKSIIELKLSNPNTGYVDSYGPGQREAFEQIARDLDMTFEEVRFEDCDCSGGEQREEVPELETVPEPGGLPFLNFLLRRHPALRFLPPNIFRPPGVPGGGLVA